jgi:outer membrane protein assembly factor BamB
MKTKNLLAVGLLIFAIISLQVTRAYAADLPKPDERYIQPYANPQINSYQPIKLSSIGKLGFKIKFNESSAPGTARFVNILDWKRALIDYHGNTVAINLKDRQPGLIFPKEPNSFIYVNPGSKFYNLQSGIFKLLRFDSIKEDLEKVPGFSGGPSLGSDWGQALFIPLEKSFISADQSLASATGQAKILRIYEKEYESGNLKWSADIKGTNPMPAVSSKNKIVVGQNNSSESINAILVYSFDGKIAATFKGEFRVLSHCIGPDGIIYAVMARGDSAFLESYNFSLERRWAIQLDSKEVGEFTSPPIVGADSQIYILGTSKVLAYKGGEKKWEYTLKANPGETSTQPAGQGTVSLDSKLIVTEGSEIISLDKTGKVIFIWKDKDGEIYKTPPVLDSSGKIYAASDKILARIN